MTIKEILKKYSISREYPLLILKGDTTMEVTARYLEGGWEEILNAKVNDFGYDEDTNKLVFEIEP